MSPVKCESQSFTENGTPVAFKITITKMNGDENKQHLKRKLRVAVLVLVFVLRHMVFFSGLLGGFGFPCFFFHNGTSFLQRYRIFHFHFTTCLSCFL